MIKVSEPMNGRLDHALSYALQKTKRLAGKRRESNLIYVMQCHGFIKVGISFNPAKRLLEMQVGCPLPIVMLVAARCEDAKQVEKAIHTWLGQYHTQGEWFKVPAADVASLLQALKAPADSTENVPWAS